MKLCLLILGLFSSLVVGAAITPPQGDKLIVDDSIRINSLADRQVIQRDASNRAIISVSGTYVGHSATLIEARAVPINGKGRETDWVVIDSSTSEGLFSSSLELAAGWYQLSVRLMDDGNRVLASYDIDHIGVGDIYITAGQSNSANFGDGRPFAEDERVSYLGLADGNWTHAVDPPKNPSSFPHYPEMTRQGSPWPKLGDFLAAELDVPIAFVSVGVGSSTVSSWTPSANEHYRYLRNAVEHFGPHGFKAVLWHQGETDSFNRASQSAYAADLEAVIAQSRVDAGWNLRWYVALVSHIIQGGSPDIIAAQQQVVDADNNVFVGAATDVLVGTDESSNVYRTDGTHFSAVGLTAHAQLWFDAIVTSNKD